MREARPDSAIVGQTPLADGMLDESEMRGETFTAHGAMPPVGTAPLMPSTAPSASDQAYGTPLYDKQSTAAPHQEQPRVAFEKVAHGGLKSKDAPASIKLPIPVADGLDQVWNESNDGTAKAQEHGGNVTRDKYSRYKFSETPAGNNSTFMPDEDAVKDDESLVGFGHSHPYEKGYENVSFSGEDLAGLVNSKPSVDFLVAGKTYFVVSRTAEFEAMTKKLDQDQSDALEQKIIKSYYDVYNANPKLSIPERAEAATLQVCKQFGLLYYRGDRSSLERRA